MSCKTTISICHLIPALWIRGEFYTLKEKGGGGIDSKNNKVCRDVSRLICFLLLLTSVSDTLQLPTLLSQPTHNRQAGGTTLKERSVKSNTTIRTRDQCGIYMKNLNMEFVNLFSYGLLLTEHQMSRTLIVQHTATNDYKLATVISDSSLQRHTIHDADPDRREALHVSLRIDAAEVCRRDLVFVQLNPLFNANDWPTIWDM